MIMFHNSMIIKFTYKITLETLQRRILLIIVVGCHIYKNALRKSPNFGNLTTRIGDNL